MYHLNLWLHTLIELWAWHRPPKELVDRRRSPWDDADRRPSHADRRNALRRQCLEEEFRAGAAAARCHEKSKRSGIAWSGSSPELRRSQKVQCSFLPCFFWFLPIGESRITEGMHLAIKGLLSGSAIHQSSPVVVHNLISIFFPGPNAISQKDSQFLSRIADDDLGKVGSGNTFQRSWGSRDGPRIVPFRPTDARFRQYRIGKAVRFSLEVLKTWIEDGCPARRK